ncbi:MAG: hypothetical protein WBC73_07915 [Phormidesmis sp.]
MAEKSKGSSPSEQSEPLSEEQLKEVSGGTSAERIFTDAATNDTYRDGLGRDGLGNELSEDSLAKERSPKVEQ